MAHYSCSEILGFPPFSLFKSMITPLPFCLTWINYKLALYGQINPPEARRSPRMSFRIVGVRRRARPRLRQSRSSGGPRSAPQLQALPAAGMGFWVSGPISTAASGARSGVGSGEVWGPPWENKTTVTECIKMLKRHTTLQKVSLWSLYFSSLSIL